MMHPRRPVSFGLKLVGVSMRILLASACLLINSVSVFAADIVNSDEVPVIRATESEMPSDPVASRWGGVYAGIDVGQGFFEDSAPATGKDWIYGGYIGYNHQIGNFIVGVEGNIDRTKIMFTDGSGVTGNLIYAGRLRAGYAFNRFMVYGTIGAEHGTVDSGNLTAFGVARDLKDTTLQLGAGVDVAITDKISLGLDYTYAKYKGFDDLSSRYPLVFAAPLDVTTQKVAARLTYTFN